MLGFRKVVGPHVLSPVQLQTGSSREQNKSSMDKKLTDSLWAVTRNRDKETRQATQVKERGVDRQLVEDEQCPVQNPRDTSSTQYVLNRPTPSTRKEKSNNRQEVQRWIGHEPATNHGETVPNYHEDCAEKESVHPEK